MDALTLSPVRELSHTCAHMHTTHTASAHTHTCTHTPTHNSTHTRTWARAHSRTRYFPASCTSGRDLRVQPRDAVWRARGGEEQEDAAQPQEPWPAEPPGTSQSSASCTSPPRRSPPALPARKTLLRQHLLPFQTNSEPGERCWADRLPGQRRACGSPQGTAPSPRPPCTPRGCTVPPGSACQRACTHHGRDGTRGLRTRALFASQRRHHFQVPKCVVTARAGGPEHQRCLRGRREH